MTTAVAPTLVLLLGLVVPGLLSPAPDTIRTTASSSLQPGPVPPAGAEVSVTGVWPLDPAPAVVTGFDPPRSAYGSGHRGVDLAGREGQPVRAAAAGRVTFAGMLAGRGVVVVAHGTTRTTYEPVTATVRTGATVAAGARIGTLQSRASHCAPRVCLHWGLLEGETYLDPLTLLDEGPVRLLPLLTPGDGPGGRPDAGGRW
ncbi:MAG TPA: M23 family metallopeptidase [Nocardioidaceae bacterium]